MNDRRTNAGGQLSRNREGAVPRLLARVVRRFCLLTRAALLMLAAAILLAVARVHAQMLPISGSVNDFNSVEYYGAPHQQDIECLLSGAQAQPLPGGLLLIKQARIEKFNLTGKLQVIAEAPECIYDPIRNVANSAGKIHVRSGDGTMNIDGEGFLWRQNDSLFIISNRVETVIQGHSKMFVPE